MTQQVADFGVWKASNLEVDSKISGENVITSSDHEHLELSEKLIPHRDTNIYEFGVFLLEMVTGRFPTVSLIEWVRKSDPICLVTPSDCVHIHSNILYAYIHACIHMHIYIHPCVHAYIHTNRCISYVLWTYICMPIIHTYTYIHTNLLYAYIHACIHMYIYIHPCVHACIHTNRCISYVYMHACIHPSMHLLIQLHTCIHAYVYTYTHTCKFDVFL